MGAKNFDNNNLKKFLREKYLSEGFDALSEQEVIMLLLTSCVDSKTTDEKIREIADSLYKNFGNLTSLADYDFRMLEKRTGLNDSVAALFKLIPQLSRIYFMQDEKITHLNSSKAARKYFRNYFIGTVEERFVVTCTDSKFRIISSVTLFTGSVNSVLISCRKIAKFAMHNQGQQSPYIFVAHNHPSGNADPSSKDYSTTNLIYRSLETIGLNLIDHIIVGKYTETSMRELKFFLIFKERNSHGYIISDPDEQDDNKK